MFPIGQLKYRVLAYHKVVSAERMANERLDLAISDTQFRTQVKWLQRAGYSFVTLSKLAQLKRSRTRGRFVAVTFDDGSTDILLHALPVLREIDAVATVFAITRPAESKAFFEWDLTAREQGRMTLQEEDRAMSWAQYLTLMDNGWEIGSHTVTHPLLTEIPLAQAREEITEAKHILEARLGVAVTSFCYPAGHANLDVVRLAEAAGYDCAVITHNSLPLPNGLMRPIYRDFSINRIGIYWYDDTARFLDKLLGFYEFRQGSRLLLSVFALARRVLSGVRKVTPTQRVESGEC